MTRPHRYAVLIDDDLRPTFTTAAHDYGRQVQSMRELRELSNGIAASHYKRDRRMQALANSASLSRQDMATAAGLHKSRVDQIIRELTDLDERRRQAEASERIQRHMPQ